MSITAYHTQYYAHELTKRSPSDSLEKLAGALVDAQVELNPHQVEAALFAFRSPLSKGAVLADEVGLGKTIEAGLVISQKWAERKRRILVITPANLRKQWYQELTEKFFLPCTILEAKSYREAMKAGNRFPFSAKEIVICSYQFARSKSGDVSTTPWDLVVIDEAHHLRNVYKPSNVIANALKQALQSAPKLLLTATPLQNSLLELYGLVSFIDERTFGDLKSFREQFARLNEDVVFQTLKNRLRPIAYRTLRRQVLPYVRYTQRLPLVQPFTPEESEDRLYNLVSDYLRRENLQALPVSQRTLMTLVLRKLLASSSFAIAGTLEALIKRLSLRLQQAEPETPLEDELDQDFETLDEILEEWPEDQVVAEQLSPETRQAIEREIADLEEFKALAVSITQNAKGRALLVALEKAFAAAERLGAARKAIIFTESRRTQDYLLRMLSDSDFRDGIVLFNGTNSDPGSRQIYQAWQARHAGTDRVTGSRTADMRSALVDYFRDEGQIMIATEAGAEGINLQFCSLVVNYDLPWNPQRIEQRIGRCHRYGQKHDVVVVNFLNLKNAADQRVFELLAEKFHLFEGVFGASDEVLGAIESGVDFERRIAAIYQASRRPDEINAAFDQLQQELSVQINEAMLRTRQQLLENFDDEVREKLREREVASRQSLNRFERLLMQLTRYELDGRADFEGEQAFVLKVKPFENGYDLGRYELPRRTGDAHIYRLGHPLAQHLIKQAKTRDLPPAEVTFDLSQHVGRISILEPHKGQSGRLAFGLLTVEALDQVEDHPLVVAVTDAGEVLEDDAAHRLLSLPGKVSQPQLAGNGHGRVESLLQEKQQSIQRQIAQRNAEFFEAEAQKIDGWADDLKLGLERDIKELDRQIKESRRAATAALTLEEKLTGQKQVRALESQRNASRRSLFDAQDEIDRRREAFIAEIEGKLQQRVELKTLFSIRWRLM
jgi:superfamily II DNA or RNA helicase